jgi:hypothetical protein
MSLLEARVIDPTHLELSKPIGAVQGQTVFVSVTEAPEGDLDRQQWLAASCDTLESAYGVSEPHYSLSMVKESNPDYGA